MKKILCVLLLFVSFSISNAQVKYYPTQVDKNGTWRGSDNNIYTTWFMQNGLEFGLSGQKHFKAFYTEDFKEIIPQYIVYLAKYTDNTYTALAFNDSDHLIIVHSWDTSHAIILTRIRSNQQTNEQNNSQTLSSTYTIPTPSKQTCYLCKGTGIHNCVYCQGKGYTIRYYTPSTYGYGTAKTIELHDRCPYCNGHGSKVCEGCNGTGTF